MKKTRGKRKNGELTLRRFTVAVVSGRPGMYGSWTKYRVTNRSTARLYVCGVIYASSRLSSSTAVYIHMYTVCFAGIYYFYYFLCYTVRTSKTIRILRRDTNNNMKPVTASSSSSGLRRVTIIIIIATIITDDTINNNIIIRDRNRYIGRRKN